MAVFSQLSLNKARWIMPDAPIDRVERLARLYDLPEIIARLLYVRGVKEDQVEEFLYPTLRQHFPDPFLLRDMEGAADYIARSIQEKRRVAIFGDFDVDGATSSAVLYRFLKHCDTQAQIYIPGRLTEGYGPNIEAFKILKEQGYEIVILLDCGTTAFDTIQAGCDLGLEIVVVDHHEAEEHLPPARFVINPKRKDDTSGLMMLAAVGVTFMVCVAVNNKLRAAGFFEMQNILEPPLKDWLDLVALGTICDMVPLVGVNRLLVRQGFAVMQNTNNPGLKALIETAGLKNEIGPYHAGFIIGPRINAGSRVHHSDLGARLLSTNDPQEANEIAWTLHDCNEKRKAIQVQMEQEAIEKVQALGLDQKPIIIVEDERWHQGLSGLVAGRLKEKYSKPACVIAYSDDEGKLSEGKGSGRSIPGVHIAQAFIDARQSGLLIKGGGHAMAGGFTIAPEQILAFKDFMYEHITMQMKGREFADETCIDALITVQGVRIDWVQRIQSQLGPFGQDYPEPLFLFSNVRVHSVDVMGANHLRLMISDWEGGARMKAVAFKALDTDMGRAFVAQGSTQGFDIVGQLRINEWQGRQSLELHIQDAAYVMTR